MLSLENVLGTRHTIDCVSTLPSGGMLKDKDETPDNNSGVVRQ
jgi:hypothetical protein